MVKGAVMHAFNEPLSIESIPGFSLPLEEKGVIGSLYGSANLHRDMVKLIDLYMRKRLKIDELISRTISSRT